jgi:long-chain acyl-CoA synthetase
MTTAASRPWTVNYAPGVPAEFDPPAESLTEMMESSVRRFGPKPALEFFGAVTTYRELGELIGRAAEGLRRAGVQAGDRVALVLPNCPQHIVAFYAVLRLGAIAVEHNPLYTDRELRHQFEDHGAKVAIVWDKLAERVRQFPADIAQTAIVSVDITRAMPRTKRMALRLPLPAARKARSALTVTAAESKSSAGAGNTLDWKELLSRGSLKRKHPRPAAGDLAVLQYTSGTTGSPKGAMLTHANLRTNAAQGRAWIPGIREGEEVVYGVLPMFHAYGLTLCLTFAMSIGARLVLLPKFDVDLVLAAARKNPPTFLPAVPPIYERLAQAARKKHVDLSSIRYAISGAMNLPVSTVELWEKATGGLLVEGYGLTETSPVALGNPIGPTRRAGTVGIPFPGTDMRVVDPDDPDREVARGEPGELLIRGPQVFQGYWKRPEETRAALLPGGWFRTGDIVQVDQDHFVTIVDRLKELIITGGFNVAPSEVEDALKGFGPIADAAVVGLPGAGGGEEVVAAVVMKPHRRFSEREIRSYCRKHLAAYKVPRRVVRIEELPKSLIGKVLRRHVREALLRDGLADSAG